MLRRISVVLSFSLLAFAACTPSGKLRNPFVKEPPFVPTTIPPDFAIVVDENHDTFYARQHIQQVITFADSMSRTTYTSYRDYNDTIARRFAQETPLSAAQLQAMWNEVVRNEMMQGSRAWINWASGADLYKRNTYTIQIRANGGTRSYQQTNGFPGTERPLMLLVQAVRLPISQDAGTPVVPPPAPVTEPETAPATQPATMPETPAATAPATQP